MTTGKPLLTADEILLDPRYERGELWDGVFVVREPSGGRSGTVGFRIASLLSVAIAESEGWGFLPEQGFFVSRDPDRVLSPDFSFISRERLPDVPERGFIEMPPEFAVEVRSPTDSWTATIEKGGVWIGHGARVVWCVDPLAKVVVVMRPGEEPAERRPGDKVTARPVLDIDVALDDIFKGF